MDLKGPFRGKRAFRGKSVKLNVPISNQRFAVSAKYARSESSSSDDPQETPQDANKGLAFQLQIIIIFFKEFCQS